MAPTNRRCRHCTRSMPRPSANGSLWDDAQGQPSFASQTDRRSRRPSASGGGKRALAASTFTPTRPCVRRTGPSSSGCAGICSGRPQVERASSATTPRKVGASYNRTWAELMRRGLDVLECPACGGRLRFVAAIMLSSAIRRILRHLGLPSDPVELAPARAPPELDDAWAC